MIASLGVLPTNTAVGLTELQFKHYLNVAKSRSVQLLPTLTEQVMATKYRQLVKEVAQVLKSQFGAQRVFLFGSLAHQAWFSLDSDIDLAVQGLPEPNYWAAWQAIEQVITDRPIDLVEWETASLTLKRTIEQDGIEL